MTRPVIAVTTPNGRVGARVVRLLLAAGVRPRLLMRDPARLAPELAGHVEAVVADQDDARAVLAATEGVDALFWVDPPTGDPDPVGAWDRIGGHAADAVRRHGIGHTVFLSSVGAERRHGVGEIDGLARTEERLDAVAAEAGTAVLHLRAGYFMSNLALDAASLRAGELVTAMPLDVPLPWVDPRDIGDVAAARLLARGWSGREVQAVHGPEDLSFVDAAAVLTATLGRPVHARSISPDDLRAQLRGIGLGDGQVEGVVGMATGTRDGLRDGTLPADPRSVSTTTPSTLAAWAHVHLPPLLDGDG